MTTVLAVAVSVLPVFLFLGALVLIDSYKLVALRAILLSVLAGAVAALARAGRIRVGGHETRAAANQAYRARDHIQVVAEGFAQYDIVWIERSDDIACRVHRLR